MTHDTDLGWPFNARPITQQPPFAQQERDYLADLDEILTLPPGRKPRRVK